MTRRASRREVVKFIDEMTHPGSNADWWDLRFVGPDGLMHAFCYMLDGSQLACGLPCPEMPKGSRVPIGAPITCAACRARLISLGVPRVHLRDGGEQELGDDPVMIPKPAAIVAEHIEEFERYYHVLRRTREPEDAMRGALGFALATEDYDLLLLFFRGGWKPLVGNFSEAGPKLGADLLAHLENLHLKLRAAGPDARLRSE